MKQKSLRLILRLLILLRINVITRFMTRRRVLILCYHGFRPDGPARSGEAHEGRHLERGMFRRQLEYLKRHKRVVDLQEVVDSWNSLTPGSVTAPGSVVVTVDDGYRSFSEIAVPELTSVGVPATIAVTTGFVDGTSLFWVDRLEYAIDNAERTEITLVVGPRKEAFEVGSLDGKASATQRLRAAAKLMSDGDRLTLVSEIESQTGSSLAESTDLPPHLRALSWDQLRDAIGTGLVGVMSHTVTHPILTTCDAEAMEREISEARQRIKAETGEECRIFCYPNGGTGDFDGRTGEAVRRAGYVAALTTVNGVNGRDTNIFQLRRHMIDDRAGWTEFVARVDGLFDVLMWIGTRVVKLSPRRAPGAQRAAVAASN